MPIPVSRFSTLPQLIGTLTLAISARIGRQIIVRAPIQMMSPTQPVLHVVTVDISADNFDEYLDDLHFEVTNSRGSSWVKVVVDEPQQWNE